MEDFNDFIDIIGASKNYSTDFDDDLVLAAESLVKSTPVATEALRIGTASEEIDEVAAVFRATALTNERLDTFNRRESHRSGTTDADFIKEDNKLVLMAKKYFEFEQGSAEETTPPATTTPSSEIYQDLLRFSTVFVSSSSDDETDHNLVKSVVIETKKNVKGVGKCKTDDGKICGKGKKNRRMPRKNYTKIEPEKEPENGKKPETLCGPPGVIVRKTGLYTNLDLVDQANYSLQVLL